tara:strand:+ start:4346 stop:5257 length:912 start_codon:yes stop_codon:yes gene_type:complete
MTNKLVVILGPTASGKTSFAVNLADKMNSDIISADSRQIYKGMDIGTGKDLEEYVVNNRKIKYHLIDILNPNQDYSVYKFRNDFFQSYNNLKKQNKNIILCGGTGLYIESVLLDYKIPNIKPDEKLRKFYAKMSINELIEELKKINSKIFEPNFHTTPRRIIRTIEILKNSKNNNKKIYKSVPLSDYIVFGIKRDRENLLKSIEHRLEDRFNSGMIEEVEGLINHGLDFERLKYFGLEYKIIGEYLFDQISIDEMKLKLKFAINKFSKRQMTFFRRMEKRGIEINWISKNEVQNIDSLIEQYL